MGVSASGKRDATNNAWSIFCLYCSCCSTFCSDGCYVQPAASFHVSAAAAANDDDGPSTTISKSFRKSLWSHCSPLWLRYACSIIQSIYRSNLGISCGKEKQILNKLLEEKKWVLWLLPAFGWERRRIDLYHTLCVA